MYGSNLAPAIEKSEGFREKMAQFPPLTSGKHRETKSFAAIMDETMGFLD
jgi:beta-1,4-N-acetylglucosaminyltransferase